MSPGVDVVELRPLDASAESTIAGAEVALNLMLSSTMADALDAGQEQMVREAAKRLEQVAQELRDEDVPSEPCPHDPQGQHFPGCGCEGVDR